MMRIGKTTTTIAIRWHLQVIILCNISQPIPTVNQYIKGRMGLYPVSRSPRILTTFNKQPYPRIIYQASRTTQYRKRVPILLQSGTRKLKREIHKLKSPLSKAMVELPKALCPSSSAWEGARVHSPTCINHMPGWACREEMISCLTTRGLRVQ